MKLAFARWYDLPDLPFRLLVYMAVVSMDEDPTPRFWGGWESLALAGGRLVPPASDDPEVKRVRRSALKAVNEAVKVLLKRGAVSVVKAAAPGRNTEYALNLANRTVHADRASSDDGGRSNGARSADTTVHAEPTQRFTVTRQSVHGEREPEEYEEQGRTEPQEEEADLRTAVTVARAREADATPIDSDEVPAAPVIPIGTRRWGSRGADAIAAATARRAARIAALRQTGDAS